MVLSTRQGLRQSCASSPDVAIVGAGLSGRLLAWRLAQAGVRVCVYEQAGRDGRSAAAWVAASMLAPIAEAAVSEPLLVELGLASLTRWSEWLPQLSAAPVHAAPVFFERKGTVVLWHASDRAEATLFRRRLQSNLPTRITNDPAREWLQVLSPQALEALEPALGTRFAQAWWLPGEGQLDNRQLLAALDTALSALNVPVITDTTIDATNWPMAGLTVDCRGLGAKATWPEVRGIRGEVIRVHAPGVRLTRPIRLLHPRYPIYIAPKQNDLYVIGATDIESEDRSPVSVRSALELLSAAFYVHPGFGEGRILELNSQCRPTLPDHRPAITYASGRPGVAPALRINGLYRHGFMIAPAVVSEAEALILANLEGTVSLGEAPQADVAAWCDARAWPMLWQGAQAIDAMDAKDAVDKERI